MNFLGIYREPEYSPGRHLSNDAKILRLVGTALEREGVSVTLSTLEEARSLWQKADLVFSMCQGPEAVSEITEWKKEGAFIVNDPEASRRTYRDFLCSSIREKDLDFPHSQMLSTDGGADLEKHRSFFLEGGAWLKRADVHATQTGDVVRLLGWKELGPALAEFRKRGLSKAVLQKHCEGDEVKFYAVKGGRLFWPYYPKDCFGYPFDEMKLRALAEHAAAALDISIYGGDAVISPEGKITLIDLNDWPSFAPCRGAAASAIAKFLKDAYYAKQNARETAQV
jgi:hypothetical protein